ncbi:RNA-directed DNA polymerase, eukaryota [Tanacetum coccineum]
MVDRRSFKSKEDLTQRISKSVFVTNFPDRCTARDFWNVCLAFGKVVDVYIPLKKSKAGKKFAFVRFLKVDNMERLIDNLCTLWIGRFRLQANPVRFQRGFWVLIDAGSIADKVKLIKHISVEGLAICAWNNNALAKIVSSWGTLSDVDAVDDASLPFKKLCVVTKPNIIINDKIKIIIKGKIYWIRIRELEAWTLEFDNEFCDNSSSEEEPVGGERNVSLQNQDIDHISESSCMKENNEFEINGTIHMQEVQSDDPFEIYKLLNKKEAKETTKGDDPTYPPGFTPNEVIGKALWSNFSYDFAFSPSVGFSGGILCVWDPNMFVKDNVTISDYFVAVRGTWAASLTKIMIVSENLMKLDRNYSYTWAIKSASKMSKLDRFLVSEGLLLVYPSLFALCLDMHLSDHRPIIMREAIVDYGPSLFRVYHSWFDKDGFDKLVNDLWKNSNFVESSKITLLRKKFQALKASIKA